MVIVPSQDDAFWDIGAKVYSDCGQFSANLNGKRNCQYLAALDSYLVSLGGSCEDVFEIGVISIFSVL